MKSCDPKSASPIRVLLAADDSIHSRLLADALKRDQSLSIVAVAPNSLEFRRIADGTNPDVVILSIHLDDDPKGGIAALREFRDAHPQIPAIIMLDSPKSEVVLDAFRAGAQGIFSEHESLETLRKCVRVVFEGQVWATTREVKFALQALASARTPQPVKGGGLNLLTRRERQVVDLLAEGLTNREIGERLGLSRHTVKNYLLKIFDKLGVSNRVELLFLTLTHPVQGPSHDQIDN